jgi:hypothetical protein
MSLKKAEKLQDVLCIKGSSINAESQKTPAECRVRGLKAQNGYTILCFGIIFWWEKRVQDIDKPYLRSLSNKSLQILLKFPHRN